MTPAEFLAAVWPTSGLYVVATLATRPEGSGVYFRHAVFVTVSQAATYAATHAQSTDVYFGVHTLKQPKLFNPRKKNPKTGEMGAFEVRSQANSNSARCFFFDLDIGVSSTRLPKYASQAEALQALRAFCKAVELPKPIVVSSGGGLHVYWPMVDDLPSDDWRTHAYKLKALATHHGLKVDPSRVTDSASVLRVAGTLNHKDSANPRQVKVLLPGEPTPTTRLLQILHDAAIKAGVNEPTKPLPGPPPHLDWGSNTDTYAGPPTTLRAVVTACEVMRNLVLAKGDVSEPEWYHTLNLVRFLENGDKLVHKVSEGHPRYDPAETATKVAQLEAKGVQPTSCAKLAEVTGSDACIQCSFHGKVKSPIVAARFRDPAPPPVITTAVGPVVIESEIPPPPKPWMRLKDGRIAFRGKTDEGDDLDQIVYEHDLYPLRRMTAGDQDRQTEKQMWRVILPRSGPKDFPLDSDALYDRRKFTYALANSSVYCHPANLQHLQEYMVAYIAELQRAQDAETQVDHLGWTQDFDAFILPSKTLLTDGTSRPSMLTSRAKSASQTILQKGSLQRQVELLRFYNHPAYVAHQFVILGSLASVIFYPTGHHGAIVNASGEPGEGKSLSLFTAASFWGQPDSYTLNGTNRGVTANFREGRAFTLSNLPVCVDEITHLPADEAKAMAMNVGQASARGRLYSTGEEKPMVMNHKATLMLTTANSSLHGLLSQNNTAGTAGSMRVFEIMLSRPGVHTKAEADDFWWELRDNYGWIGEAFVTHVVRHRDEIVQRVRDTVKSLDVAGEIRTAERFWSATVAAVLVACEVANEIGLLGFNAAVIRNWVLSKQLPYMRGVVTSEYTSPLSALADYVESIHGSILVTNKQDRDSNTATYQLALRGTQLLGEYDKTNQVLWVLRKGFKDHCAKIGVNFIRALEELSIARPDSNGVARAIVPRPQVKRVLGAGTAYAMMQTWCFQVDMSLPEVAGTVNMGLASMNLGVKPTPPTGKLKPVG